MSTNIKSAPFLCFLLLVPVSLQAQMSLGRNITISFASVAEGKETLTNRDDFVERMSPFDRAARLKTNKDITERQYLEFVGNNILEWNDAEKQKIDHAFQDIKDSLTALTLPLPEKILIIKTTGNEEGGAAYTRANAIVLTKNDLQASKSRIQELLSHELFHIMTRANPDLRERLYAAIGFMQCNEVVFPSWLASRKITNPDAPKNDHCISVTVAGREQCAIPILFSSSVKYDVNRGGEFFDYLQFKLLLAEQPKNEAAVSPTVNNHKPELVDIQQVSGFFDKVGKNTGYIIHPEEVLADNFALLVLKRHNLPSPGIIKRIQTILADRATITAQDQ